MSYRTIQTYGNNDEKVHAWSWKQRISELYKEKLNYFLRQQLISKPEVTGLEWIQRIHEIKEVLRKEDWDDVSMNRASMGYCGWIQCGECPPTTRSLSILRLVITSDLDRDVIDSFHSFKCFEEFNKVRALLTEVPSSLRVIPDSLRKEYDVQYFGEELVDEEKWDRLKQHVENSKQAFIEPLSDRGAISNSDEVQDTDETPTEARGTDNMKPNRSNSDQGDLKSEKDSCSNSHSQSSSSGYRTVMMEDQQLSNKLSGRRLLKNKDWMYFRPEREILVELNGIEDGRRESGLIQSKDMDNSDIVLFEYPNGRHCHESGSNTDHPLTASLSSGSGGLVSSLRKSDSTSKSKNVRWAEQLEHSFGDEIFATAEDDGDSMQYFTSMRELLGIPDASSEEEDSGHGENDFDSSDDE